MNSLISHNGGPPEGYSVTNKGIKLAEANTRRKFWSCVNTSDTGIYLALYEHDNGECGASVGKGVYLVANGGSFELNNTNMYYGAIWAIHGSTGEKRVTVQAG